MRDATLCLLINKDEILLGRKKKGFGKDKINGFGGKVNKGEPIEVAALRELYEESNLKAHKNHMVKHAELDFFFPEPKAKEWNQRVHVFIIKSWEGIPQESKEMTCEKFNINSLPFEKMWADDKHWFPHLLKGEKIRANFYFKEDCNTVEKYEIVEVESFD